MLRLRPILMTSFAFLLGILPLVFASGAGATAVTRWAPRCSAACLLSTVLNLFFTPALYLMMQRLRERARARRHAAPAPAPA